MSFIFLFVSFFMSLRVVTADDKSDTKHSTGVRRREDHKLTGNVKLLVKCPEYIAQSFLKLSDDASGYLAKTDTDIQTCL